jgi:hypothetical protein
MAVVTLTHSSFITLIHKERVTLFLLGMWRREMSQKLNSKVGNYTTGNPASSFVRVGIS